MPSLDRMTPGEVYELVAGFLKRIQPEAPPYPGGGRNARKRPLQSPPALSLLPMAAAWGGPPPDGGFTPLIPGGPTDPEDPNDPNEPGGPFNPAPPIVEDPGDGDDPEDPNDPNQPGGPFDDADDGFTVVDHDIQAPHFGGAWSAGFDPEDFNYLTRNNGQSLFVFTDAFDQPAVGPWWTVLRGAWTAAATPGILNITGIGSTGNVPLAVLLYNPEDYTGAATIDIVLDNVTAGAVKYAIARGANNGSGLLNGYAFRVIGNGSVGQCSIGRIDNGVFTTLGAPFGQAFAAGESFGIRVTGTTVQARRNGAQVNTDRTDATYTSGKLGIGGDSTVPAFRSAALSNT